MRRAQLNPLSDDELTAALAIDLKDDVPIILPDPLTLQRTITGTPTEIRAAIASWTKEVHAHIALDEMSLKRSVTITIAVV